MAYTEFCVRSGGSNLNAGTRTGSSTEPGTAADFTYASGNWVAATGVFTVASGDPAADGVAVGDFASVYANGATIATFVGRVTARDATTITVSITAKHGTVPADGTGNRTLKIGGAWAGPAAAVTFPAAGFILGTATNAAGDPVRVNYKNDQTLSTTAVNTYSGAGPFTLQGYTTSYGDGGRLQWNGNTTGASRIILSVSGVDVTTQDFELFNNGATGSASGYSHAGARGLVRRLIVHDVRGTAFISTSPLTEFEECEAYAYNQAAAADLAGFTCIRATDCIAHSHTGANNTSGFFGTTNTNAYVFTNCVAYNVDFGFRLGATGSSLTLRNCDVYDTVGFAVWLNVTSATPTRVFFQNCNFLKSSSNRIAGQGTSTYHGLIVNCSTATAGAYANVSADTGIPLVQVIDAVTYASGVGPWADPDNGDFTITHAAAKGTGRGVFLQNTAGPTLAYPDIGAAQGSSQVPAVTDVRTGVAYSNSTMTGTLTLPAAGDVESGVQYGAGGTEYTGTLVVGGTTQLANFNW